MKILMARFGGIGDALILTPVAKAIKKKYSDAELFFSIPEHQVQLFENLNLFDTLWPTKRIGGLDLVPNVHGWGSLETVKSYFGLIYDFKYSVELNSLYRGLASHQGYWMNSQNSNFFNWVDLSLAWANIDPHSIKDEDKRPIYKVKENEQQAVKEVLGKMERPLVGVDLVASSLCRTWYHPDQIGREFFELYPKGSLLFYNGAQWQMCKKTMTSNIPFGEKPLRESAALIDQMDAFVATDTGMSHIAEAVETKTIVTYTTVPAWTRCKYYKFAHEIQTSAKCSPCFSLERFCPRIMKKADECLTEREKQIREMSDRGMQINEAALKMGTTPQGLQLEFEAIVKKLEGYQNKKPECIEKIMTEMIIDKLKELLN